MSDYSRVEGMPVPMGSRLAVEYDTTSRDREWLNPIAMSTLQSVVKKRGTRAVLNGIEYELSYERKIYPVTGEREVIRLKRTDGELVPFGFISVDRVLKFEFET